MPIMIGCQTCGKTIAQGTTVCPHCGNDPAVRGTPPPPNAPPITGWARALILLVVFVSVYAAGRAVFAPMTATEAEVPQGQTSGRSPTCGPISGESAKDYEALRAFCAEGIPANGAVVGAYGVESLLWVKVSREMADELRADRLTAEQLVKNWMRGWRIHSGRTAVTVTVEWQDVEIATGTTTLTAGDRVTIR